MNFSTHEVSPRFRRRSTFRVWSKDQEQQLLQCEQQLQSEVLAGKTKPEQLLDRWEALGHRGYTADELSKKVSSIHRIHEMLKPKSSEVTQLIAEKGLRSGSLQEDALWEEETLHMIRAGKTDEFRSRLRSERRASQVADAQNRTGLHHAASSGNLTLVEVLADSGADIDAKDNDGRTPIFFCLQHGWDEVTEWLVERGAAVAFADVRGVTPLHLAVYTNSRRATRMLLKLPGVDANAADEKGTTPLHIAAHRASVDVLQLLLDAGADPGLTDKRGNLPVALATRMEKKANARVLTTLRAAATAVLASVRMQKAGAASPTASPKAPPAPAAE